MDDDELGVFASPGDELGDANNKSSGPGTYVSADGSRILSSLCGRVREHQSMISVSRSTMNRLATLPFVGAEIYGVVTRISSLMATVDILVVDGKPLAEPSIAIIRKENVREAEIDKVRLEDCFHPGDTVCAVVASLGDARSYYLTTARSDLGVIPSASADDDSMALRKLAIISAAE